MNFNCIGYHGTPYKNVDAIQRNGYQFSDEHQWFGAGVYFFGTMLPLSDGIEEAKKWVLFVKKESEWAVFKSTIETNEYFDCVNNSDDRAFFDKLRKELFALHIKSGRKVEHFKDRVVFKELEKKQSFIVVRALVDATKKSYFNYVISHPQIQICVKDLIAITDNELIASGK